LGRVCYSTFSPHGANHLPPLTAVDRFSAEEEQLTAVVHTLPLTCGPVSWRRRASTEPGRIGRWTSTTATTATHPNDCAAAASSTANAADAARYGSEISSLAPLLSQACPDGGIPGSGWSTSRSRSNGSIAGASVWSRW